MCAICIYIVSLSCRYPAAVGSVAILQLPEADQNHHFWLTLQMNYNPKYQTVRKVSVTIRSILSHLVVLCHLSGNHMLASIAVFVCLAIKLRHVSVTLSAVHLCVSSSSFPPISQDWLFAPLSLVQMSASSLLIETDWLLSSMYAVGGSNGKMFLAFSLAKCFAADFLRSGLTL